jgi:hypothetical protein
MKEENVKDIYRYLRTDKPMKPPRADARGILHFFGGIHRSTRLRSASFGGSTPRIHAWAYPAFVAVGYYGGVGRPWSSAKADKKPKYRRTSLLKK